MRTAMWLAVTVIACDADTLAEHPPDPDLALLPVDEAAPPGALGLGLTVEGVMETNTPVTFTVVGAAPGQRVFLGYSDRRPFFQGPCPAQLDGICLGIGSPNFVLGRATADANGMAVFVDQLPPSQPDGRRAFFQAAAEGPGAATSQVWERVNPFDVGGVAEHARSANATIDIATGAMTMNHKSFWWGNQYTASPLCQISSAFASTQGPVPVTCPGCEFSFAVARTSSWETPAASDCGDLLGLDPAIDTPDELGWGFDIDHVFPDGHTGTLVYSVRNPALGWQEVAEASWAQIGQTWFTEWHPLAGDTIGY